MLVIKLIRTLIIRSSIKPNIFKVSIISRISFLSSFVKVFDRKRQEWKRHSKKKNFYERMYFYFWTYIFCELVKSVIECGKKNLIVIISAKNSIYNFLDAKDYIFTLFFCAIFQTHFFCYHQRGELSRLQLIWWASSISSILLRTLIYFLFWQFSLPIWWCENRVLR